MRMSFAHVRLSVASILAAVMLLSFARPAVAQEPGAGAPPAASSADNRDEAIIRLLETTVVDVAYDRIDFEKIIQELRDRHSLNIHISWTELEAADVRRDQRIEMKLKSVTLSTLLDLLLREAAAGSKAADEVVYHVESGVIVIDLGQRRREERIMRMYPVSDLLESGYAIRRFANTPVLGMELTGREFVGGERPQQPDAGGFGGGGGGASPSIFGSSGEDPQRVTEMERVQQLIDLVTECVEPDSWDIAGGDIGSIRYANASLIIRQTLRNHQKLAAFLAMLRETRPQPLDADVAIVRLRADKAAELRQAAGERFPRLAPEALQALAMAGDAQGVLFRATTSGAAGQAMLLSALTQREAVTSAHAIVGDQSSAYEPQSTTSTAGLELILLPLVVPGSEAMTLDVQMALVPPAQVTPRAVRLGVGGADTTIDQVQRSMRTVSSQTSVALGDVIALTIPQEINSQAAAAEYEDWLLVRVRKAE